MENTELPIGDIVTSWAKERPDALLASFVSIAPDGGFEDEAMTWGMLERNAMALAGWLQSIGIGKGDPVAIMLQNHPEFIEMMVATAFLGAVYVPIDPRSTGDKLVYMLEFTACKALILGDYAAQLVLDVEPRLGALKNVLLVGTLPQLPETRQSWIQYDAALAGAVPLAAPEKIAQGDPLFMMFTSGTTGNPKAVVRSHASHLRDYKLLLGLGIDPSYRLYTGLPLCHVNAQYILNIAMRRGQHMVFSRKFTKTRMLDICRAYDCQTFSLLGGMTPEFFSNPPRVDDKGNPVKLVISSGMPAALWDAYRERYGVQIT